MHVLYRKGKKRADTSLSSVVFDYNVKKLIEKQGVPQSQNAAKPRHQEEEKKDTNYTEPNL